MRVTGCSTPDRLGFRIFDTEVEKLHMAVAGDEHISGLEIAMQDEVLVRVADGRAHLAEQPETRRNVELMAVAVLGDR